jgi:U3 small nucleolar RNA-associated protein 19
MPSITADAPSGRKRKPTSDARSVPKVKRRREETGRNASELDLRIQKLENELSKTPNGKSQICDLISFFDLSTPDSEDNLKVAICLCRVFSRMMASGQFTWQKLKEEPGWQIKEYQSYQSIVQQCLKNGHGSTPTTMLKLHMKMLKEESSHNPNSFRIFESFPGLVTALVDAVDGADVRKTFAEDYVRQYQDCCYYSLEAIT